ncbi:bifunctional adenosylcobinamide kinase/adenosylcobinamide-phosphate guanylyltransferase [Cyanobium sp. Morenito 9A2]|uniref:bifunctional adenosylcobinamide kinase/adenosylcobinamide-phosphate guanylyltransferase n=1 Tax=Cyanobium sp. Morenito 9A2 TaxID=2823718 RepID=UPI0020CBE22F|nr:bifunctional adenosylcobinamide kinase/adenosylcobinamide-phosphate guanylyltransferase [Cyanobium sp. Morenito 9A2]MCP9850566.1 bifunctional adenosylcobinamide kinase/adenosylcobinamide-phosphate guanylyltransferase [Cyanobium sp. Morenito 9A2]
MGAELTLITGPSRGAKSRWAEHLARRAEAGVIYVATGPALPLDLDWQRRLDRHRARRPSTWRLEEVGADLPDFLRAASAHNVLLIDSLGTWLAYHLDLSAGEWELQQQALLSAVGACTAPMLVVAEECGWGVVPATAVGGRFRDRLGRLEQLLMAQAQAAWLVLHGRAIDLLACSLPVPEG